MYLVCMLINESMCLYSYPSTHSISGLAANGSSEQFKLSLTITIKWTQRNTARPGWSEFWNALGGRKQASLEMHLEAVMQQVRKYAPEGHDHANLEAMIEQDWIYTWRPWWSQFEDMHLEAIIAWTWRPKSTEFGDTFGGRDCASLEAVIVQVWRCTWRPWSCELGGCNCATLN